MTLIREWRVRVLLIAAFAACAVLFGFFMRPAHAQTLAQQIICLEFGINNQVIGSIVTLNSGFCPPETSTTTAALTVTKHVVNDGGGTATASDFTIHVTGTSPSLSSFPGSETGTIISLEAGSFSVTEDASSTYAMTLSGDCSGSVAAGDAKTCTITNTFNPPPPPTTASLTVIKTVVGAQPPLPTSPCT